MCLQFPSRGLWFNSGIISIRLKAWAIPKEKTKVGDKSALFAPPFFLTATSLCVLGRVGREACSSGCGSLRRECYAGLITLRVPYYVSSCHFQFEPPHCSGGTWFSSHYCFDWGLIVTRLNLSKCSKQGKLCSTGRRSSDHMFTISSGQGGDEGNVYLCGGTPSYWPLHIESHV